MSRLLSALAVLALMIGLTALQEDGRVSAVPGREGAVDISVNITLPEEGGSYQTELGLSVQVNVTNEGTDWANDTGRLSMKIKNRNTGQIAFSALNIQFTNLGPGETRAFSFQNWSQAFAGQFQVNVTATYLGDPDLTDNYRESNFSMWTENWPFPPELTSGSVSPLKGNTTTEFSYAAVFEHNEEPTQIRVEIDGVNHTLVETDPGDNILQDGKRYGYSTRLSPGNHKYRLFAKAEGWSLIRTEFVEFPWVNISLKNPQVIPTVGYVTTTFKFSVDYGSVFNLPPDALYVDTGSARFDLTRSSPTPNYLKGDVRFETDIPGLELIPSPVTYYINLTTGVDSYSLGPFEMEGPSMEKVEITGTVTGQDMIPLEGTLVTITPGNVTGTTDELGRYLLEVFKGRDYRITYSAEGFLGRSYTIDLLNDRMLDIELEPLPEGSSVSGFVLTEGGGELVPVEGVTVNLTGPEHAVETVSGPDGSYMFEDVPAGSGYVVTAAGERFRTFTFAFNVSDSEAIVLNITLTEREMGVSVLPDPGEGRIPVSASFEIDLVSEPDPATLEIFLFNATSEVEAEVVHVENSTTVSLIPAEELKYDSIYTLRLSEGVLTTGGMLMVWNDVKWDYVTEMQEPMEEPRTHPSPDQVSVPLDVVISISWGIGLNMSTFEYEIVDLDRVEEVASVMTYEAIVDWSDSGRTDTLVTIAPGNLNYNTRYSLEVEGGLEDLYGRTLFSNSYSLEFLTVGEPDSDGDGIPDSLDAFPDDPDNWTDLDNDGYGDQTSDSFPDDPGEWADTDGDGIGDNADNDDDNDGMPDTWEEKYALDPKDPADAFEDPDDDGFSNLEEYLENTDPRDASSSPEGDTEGLPTWTVIAGIAALVLIAAVVVLILVRSRESSALEE